MILLRKFFSKFFGSAKDALSIQQLQHWDEFGFVVLPKFFDAERMENFRSQYDELWRERSIRAGQLTIDILEGRLANTRQLLCEVPDECRNLSHKVNDLYLDAEFCRQLNLDAGLSKILGQLLDDKPLVINSLCFAKGSQQPYHFDTYYMPPPKPNRMVVSSICLEDQDPASGPLSYYPGSHKIPPYVFNHGGIHAGDEALEPATQYIEDQLQRLGLTASTFVGEVGDVFLWHAQLYHGGLPIADSSLTRKSLVTHYWRGVDMPEAQIESQNEYGDYLDRPHPASGPG